MIPAELSYPYHHQTKLSDIGQYHINCRQTLYSATLRQIQIMKPTPEAHEEAKRNPNGYVYVLDGTFQKNEGVSPEHIVGAWKVDSSGIITGEFISNPNHKPRATDSSTLRSPS